MANSRTQTIYYKPRYTQMEAYDLLPSVLRDALKEGAQEWDTVTVLKWYRKYAKEMGHTTSVKKMYKLIYDWHRIDIAKGLAWRPRLPGQSWKDIPLSPHVLAKAAMVMS